MKEKKNPRVCTKPSAAAAVRLTPKYHSDLFLIMSIHKYFDFQIVAVLSTFVNELDFFSISNTVFPHIRLAGIIFLLGLKLRVLLECGYCLRASIIFSMCKHEKLNPQI